VNSESDLRQYLPYSLAATFLVVVVPILLESALKLAGLVRSPFIAVALAVVLAGGAAWAGAKWWARRPGSRDLVFAELMIWGLVRRFRTERRLARAANLLGVREEAGGNVGGKRSVEMLEQLSSGLEARDAYTHGHSRRVARLAHVIATRMGLDGRDVAKIRTAAAIHDVGKIRVPRAILNKPIGLTDAEFEIMRRHSADGAEMAAGIGDPDIAAMVRHHHERLDGSGYPDRLAGEEIPLGARIIAVADVFDSMTSSRPYRPALAHTKAIEILKRDAGSRLDPKAVRTFMSYYSGRNEIEGWALAGQVTQLFTNWLGGAFKGVAAPVAQAAATVAAAAMLSGAALGLGVGPHDSPGRNASLQSAAASYQAAGHQAVSSRSGRRRKRRRLAAPFDAHEKPSATESNPRGAMPGRPDGHAPGTARPRDPAPANPRQPANSPAPSGQPPSTPESAPPSSSDPAGGEPGTDSGTQPPPPADPDHGKKNGIGVGGVPPGHEGQ
jgi:hypothetical protein